MDEIPLVRRGSESVPHIVIIPAVYDYEAVLTRNTGIDNIWLISQLLGQGSKHTGISIAISCSGIYHAQGMFLILVLGRDALGILGSPEPAGHGIVKASPKLLALRHSGIGNTVHRLHGLYLKLRADIVLGPPFLREFHTIHSLIGGAFP